MAHRLSKTLANTDATKQAISVFFVVFGRDITANGCKDGQHYHLYQCGLYATHLYRWGFSLQSKLWTAHVSCFLQRNVSISPLYCCCCCLSHCRGRLHSSHSVHIRMWVASTFGGHFSGLEHGLFWWFCSMDGGGSCSLPASFLHPSFIALWQPIKRSTLACCGLLWPVGQIVLGALICVPEAFSIIFVVEIIFKAQVVKPEDWVTKTPTCSALFHHSTRSTCMACVVISAGARHWWTAPWQIRL